MANRTPVFEAHIKPMFRLLDQLHMLRLPAGRRMDLFDYQQVRDNHVEILEFLRSASPMPPQGVGGPWPDEWISLFERWTTTGFARLTRATGENLQLSKVAADRYTLSCTVSLPNPNAVAWFDIVQASADAQRYELVMEDTSGASPAPTPAAVEERIRGPLTVAAATVVDAAGDHVLPFPA